MGSNSAVEGPRTCRSQVTGYVWSATVEFARLSARSCSEVKACPQVLHLHFAFGVRAPHASGMSRPVSLGRNDITSSPPHCKQCRLPIVMLVPQAWLHSSGHN